MSIAQAIPHGMHEPLMSVSLPARIAHCVLSTVCTSCCAVYIHTYITIYFMHDEGFSRFILIIHDSGFMYSLWNINPA